MSPLIRYSIFIISRVSYNVSYKSIFGDFNSLYLLRFTVVLVGAAVVDILSDKEN